MKQTVNSAVAVYLAIEVLQQMDNHTFAWTDNEMVLKLTREYKAILAAEKRLKYSNMHNTIQ